MLGKNEWKDGSKDPFDDWGISDGAGSVCHIFVDDNGSANFINIQTPIDDSTEGETTVAGYSTYASDGNRDIDFKNPVLKRIAA